MVRNVNKIEIGRASQCDDHEGECILWVSHLTLSSAPWESSQQQQQQNPQTLTGLPYQGGHCKLIFQ